MIYDIKQWSGLLFGNNQTPLPIVYIKPDENLLAYVKDNNYRINVSIHDTDSSYDGRNVSCIVNSAEMIPNYRPVFGKTTEWMCLVLETLWSGYPLKMGRVDIESINNITPSSFTKSKNNAKENQKNMKLLKQEEIKTPVNLFKTILCLIVSIPLLIMCIICIVKTCKTGEEMEK